MTDKKPQISLNFPANLEKKGYTPVQTEIGGYKGPKAALAKPPTGGSAVKPPVKPK